jgi:hypothetical protein
MQGGIARRNYLSQEFVATHTPPIATNPQSAATKGASRSAEAQPITPSEFPVPAQELAQLAAPSCGATHWPWPGPIDAVRRPELSRWLAEAQPCRPGGIVPDRRGERRPQALSCLGWPGTLNDAEEAGASHQPQMPAAKKFARCVSRSAIMRLTTHRPPPRRLRVSSCDRSRAFP